jgi:hypothetical protein
VIAGAIAYLVPLSLVFVTAGSGERLGLAGVYATAVGLGVLLTYAIPGGLSNSDADYLALSLGGVAAGGVLGLTIGLSVTPITAWRHVLVGLFGGGAFPAAAIALLAWAVLAGGFCLG